MAESPDVLHEGRFVRLVRRGRWEWAERTNASGVVVVVATTPHDEVLFVEQHRIPVGSRVLELPAGLAGDVTGEEDEPLARAANRELEEETGWRADTLEAVTAGPVSAGMTSEVLTFFLARGLTRVGEGGGDPSEDIVVHAVPVAEAHDFLVRKAAEGVMADPKVYTGLYFLERSRRA